MHTDLDKDECTCSVLSFLAVHNTTLKSVHNVGHIFDVLKSVQLCQTALNCVLSCSNASLKPSDMQCLSRFLEAWVPEMHTRICGLMNWHSTRSVTCNRRCERSGALNVPIQGKQSIRKIYRWMTKYRHHLSSWYYCWHKKGFFWAFIASAQPVSYCLVCISKIPRRGESSREFVWTLSSASSHPLHFDRVVIAGCVRHKLVKSSVRKGDHARILDLDLCCLSWFHWATWS